MTVTPKQLRSLHVQLSTMIAVNPTLQADSAVVAAVAGFAETGEEMIAHSHKADALQRRAKERVMALRDAIRPHIPEASMGRFNKVFEIDDPPGG